MMSRIESADPKGLAPVRSSHLEEDFSVVIGGPLYQALRRAHLSGDALQLARRRVVTISLFAWLPLLVLAVLDGRAWGGTVGVPFLYDIDVHVRFLVALPLLLIAELVVHKRMRGIVRQFVSMGIVRDAARERFDAAIESAMRLRDSVAIEIFLIVLVYAVGRLLVWPHYAALDTPTWYAAPDATGFDTNLAGYWYFLVSLPLCQFMLLRWYFRLFVWARFLWNVSRIDLAYSPMHPDRRGGIGFLTQIAYAFAPLLLAQSALLAGTLANRILFDGASLLDFKLDIVAWVLLAVVSVVAPLLVFVAPLARAKRESLHEYRHLAKRYVDGFESKWLHGAEGGEPLIGHADVQSLADMANSYSVVQGMRVLPIGKDMAVQLFVLTLLPFAPLLLTMISLEELIGRLVKAVF